MGKIFKNRISLWSILKGWVRARKTNYERMNSDIRQKLITGYQKHPVELQQHSSLLKERQISVWRTCKISSPEAKANQANITDGQVNLTWLGEPRPAACRPSGCRRHFPAGCFPHVPVLPLSAGSRRSGSAAEPTWLASACPEPRLPQVQCSQDLQRPLKCHKCSQFICSQPL